MAHGSPPQAIGHQVVRLGSVDSTNRTAAGLIHERGATHGTVVVARTQTAGRGQRGRTWLSAPDLDLTLSIVLEPPALRADLQFGLAKLAALAVHDVVRQAGVEGVRVKWPNDVLVDRLKVAGILIECDLAGDRVRHAVVGVGINVNSMELDATLAATSIRLATGRPWDLEQLLQEVLAAFQRRHDQWAMAPHATDRDYAAALWSAGRWADMDLDGTRVVLRPVDVDPAGRLLVEHEDGRVAAYGLDRLRFSAR